MAIVNVNGISGINSITAQSTSLNFYTAAGNNLPISAGTLNVGTGASVSSPATNVLTLGTNNSESVRIDSSGRLGLNSNLSGASAYNRLVVNSPDSSCWISLQSANTGSTINSDGIDIGLNGSNQGHFWLRENADLLIATNNTERLRIDSSGRVTMPYQPSFFAYATGGDTTTANDTIIVFGGTAHNIGSHYSTSTGRFTAPVTGVYAFHAQIWAKNGGGYSRTIFRVAGTQVTQNGFHPGTVSNSNDHSFQMSMVRYVSAGDAIDVMVNLGPLTYYGGGSSSPHSYFSGYLVG